VRNNRTKALDEGKANIAVGHVAMILAVAAEHLASVSRKNRMQALGCVKYIYICAGELDE
jgi:hypothetical protein